MFSVGTHLPDSLLYFFLGVLFALLVGFLFRSQRKKLYSFDHISSCRVSGNSKRYWLLVLLPGVVMAGYVLLQLISR